MTEDTDNRKSGEVDKQFFEEIEEEKLVSHLESPQGRKEDSSEKRNSEKKYMKTIFFQTPP